MDRNLMRMVFIFNAATTGIGGLLINLAERYLPVSFTRTYRYGKFATNTKHPTVAKLEVPKKWFAHFYVFAAPTSSCVLALVFYKYVCNGAVPEIVYRTLDVLLGTTRKALVAPENTILATVLLTIQCWKRYYETHHVSIFSDAKINVSHYIVGFVHYVGALSCLIGESYGFVRGSQAILNWDQLTYVEYTCGIVFLWSSYKQLTANFVLANLRKNTNGNVIITRVYKVPKGELFDYISSPLQFTEILMYSMLTIILWKSSTFHYVYIWVLINQTECALLNHWWHLKTFKTYPKERKILIPFVL